MSDLVGFNRIKENSKENIIIICETLISILEKIIAKPNDSHSRRISLQSDEVANKLMPYSGGLEVLFEMGYEEVSFIYIYLFHSSVSLINFFLVEFSNRKKTVFSCHYMLIRN